MKTLTSNAVLTSAVISQLGYMDEDLDDRHEDLMATLSDIANHGIAGGFGGFIYHTDTTTFAEANKAAILATAREMADCLGVDGAYSLIASFNCLGEDYTPDSVADAIHNPDHEDRIQVMNALAWFAAEEVAREVTES